MQKSRSEIVRLYGTQNAQDAHGTCGNDQTGKRGKIKEKWNWTSWIEMKILDVSAWMCELVVVVLQSSKIYQDYRLWVHDEKPETLKLGKTKQSQGDERVYW